MDALMRHASGNGLCVYGAGKIGEFTVEELRRRGIGVRHVIDRATWPGRTCKGLPVLGLDAAAGLIENVHVITSIFNRDFDFSSTRDALMDLGAASVWSFSEFLRTLDSYSGDFFWLSYPFDVPAEEEAALGAAFADTKSRDLFASNLRARRLCDHTALPAPDPRADEYVPRDVPNFDDGTTYSRVVDGGAYDGDTLAVFARFEELSSAILFEPDTRNYALLASRADQMVAQRPDLEIARHRLGLWSERAVLTFSGGNGEGSAVGGGADGELIQCAALDEILPSGFNPTFIKLDIEGAEPQALLGARRSIVTHRPRLAIAVYHMPDHIVTIPRTILGWNLGYSMYLRAYAHCGFETVLFCVPT